MPTLVLTNFNIVVSVLGGWISLFGLVSYLCKENFYLSEALISLLAGVAFSPSGANFVRPLDYAGSQANLDTITLYFSRLVLGIQLVLAGVQLPSRYLKQQWRPLVVLLGPIMVCMWLSTSLLVWALVPQLPFLHALAIGSCVTPTDPVLSNVIVKGRFADKNVPVELQRIVIAESGANDGLGYPFLFLALYLIEYTGFQAATGAEAAAFPVPGGGAAHAMGLWFGETLGYTILLSVAYGAVVGFVAKELLHWAEQRRFVDRESFLVFAISLALFITGTCGLIGSDDVLACFIAGNVFTWDDWFRLETEDDSLQPTMDMLLNVAVFMWFGAVCPWHEFVTGAVPIYRLIGLSLLVLLLRRLPWVLAVHRLVPQIEGLRQAVFVGFFGPVGVSAIFYLYITLDFLERLSSKAAGAEDGHPRPDVASLADKTRMVVWFLSISSIVVHGLSIPLGKLGLYLPRTLSRALTLTGGGGASSTSAGASTLAGSGQAREGGGRLPLPFQVGSRVHTFVMRRDKGADGVAGGGGGGGGGEEGVLMTNVPVVAVAGTGAAAPGPTAAAAADMGDQPGQHGDAVVVVVDGGSHDVGAGNSGEVSSSTGAVGVCPPQPVYRIGGSIIPPGREDDEDLDGYVGGHGVQTTGTGGATGTPDSGATSRSGSSSPPWLAGSARRTIRFPDDQSPV